MKKRNCLIALTILWVIVIFSFSLQPADISSDTSMGFARKLLRIIMPGFLEYMDQMSVEELASFHHIIRKGAHFTEYFVLGMLSHASVVAVHEAKANVVKANVAKGVCFWALLFCVCIASVDEIIQLFVSGRAGRIQDVLLDSAGALTGILLVHGLMRLIAARMEDCL